ncbi:hypothetical protein F4820DRAFT_124740 [Hypoxylon rubiginosum]|uniref:Uncharacterized protein n=1 Tax=Hypoxylon rubiginosum TaxID=110542 RepID=A0ACB9Z9L5_9PEZI|nr:hypothetical protein F4820DRAFT_124740 [Hypoxylon rubiginosum]
MSNTSNPIEYFGLSCPAGGDFYICQDSRERFIGCCDVDPCADGSGRCPSSGLYPAGFDTSRYDEISVQDCASPGTSQNWFTCTNGPFMGCCRSNPCGDGSCPTDDLVAAKLSDDPENASIFLTSSSATSSSSTISASTSPTSSATPTPASSNHADTSNSGSETPVAKIVGGTVGGVAALILIICFVFLYMRRRAADAREKQVVADDHMGTSNPPWSPYKDSYAGSPTVQGTPSPAFPSPSLTNNGRTSVVSQLSSHAPTWDSRHASYATTGAPTPSNLWAGGASQQQQQQKQQPHQPMNLNTVSELEASTSPQYHELDGGPVPQERRSDMK